MPEYVIYCRKSTDEASGKQTQSIPDQIEKCLQYAQSLNLDIKEKPAKPRFELSDDLIVEDMTSDLHNRKIYQESRKYYIIKEQKTAKEPWARWKWKKLIDLVRRWYIKWIISYSPDRQARNMLEWWELIDCVDKEQVDLKYSNFHFEPNASGKMMLWIWFTLSKQYSDKLSEDVSRGTKSAVSRGKAMWNMKYGFKINEEGYHEPHPVYFPLIKEAFQMKLYDNVSDQYVADWLIKRWFKLIHQTGEIDPLAKNLHRAWRDPFYYGMFVFWKHSVDLKEVSKYYKPVITEEEHQILIERYYWNVKQRISPSATKDENSDFMPFNRGQFITHDGYVMVHNLPNKARFAKKLKELQKTNPHATLWDVVKPSQIRYACKNKNSDMHWFEITFDKIEEVMMRFLKKHLIKSKKVHEMYTNYVNNALAKEQSNENKERRRLQIQLNRTIAKKQEYIRKNIGRDRDREEEKVYQEEKERLERVIYNLQTEMDELGESERNLVMELEAVLWFMKWAEEYYQNANFVQKRKISELVCSNIIINNLGRIQVYVNSGLEWLLSLNMG